MLFEQIRDGGVKVISRCDYETDTGRLKSPPPH
jgi:hypothetical protein